MRITAIIVFFLVPFVFLVSAIDKISVHGFYNGENIIIVNPYSNQRFAIEKIEINSKVWQGDLASSAIEIELQNMNFRLGEFLTITIYYHDDFPQPYVFNSDALRELKYFEFKEITIDKKTEKFSWKVNITHSKGKFLIEQYWGTQWLKIGEVKVEDSISYNSYSFVFNSNSGKNLFRITYLSPLNSISISPHIKYTSKKQPVSIIKNTGNEISFSTTSRFMVYNTRAQMVKDGTAEKVDMSDLPSGRYFLLYDGNLTEFRKK
ncbi:MAG: hypothetical protein N2Z72_06705 [Bacteroidales bacterium]|nr:hypothetical protein [Bacteroidales bacterium]